MAVEYVDLEKVFILKFIIVTFKDDVGDSRVEN